MISPPPQARKKAQMFCPSPLDLTTSPKVAPMTFVTRYPETKGEVTMNRPAGGANGSGAVEGSNYVAGFHDDCAVDRRRTGAGTPPPGSRKPGGGAMNPTNGQGHPLRAPPVNPAL